MGRCAVTTDRLKRILAVLLVGGGLLVVVAFVVTAAKAQSEVSSGADPADAFTPVPLLPGDVAGTVEWLPEHRSGQRILDDASRTAVEGSWLRAWDAMDRAAQGDVEELELWFGGSALERVRSLAGSGVRQVAPVHRLEVTFHSDDGTVVGLDAHEVVVVRGGDGEEPLVAAESFDAVILLEDGRWRLHHLRRRSASVLHLDGGSRSVDGPIRGVNHLPRANPWGDTWVEYDPVVADADLDLVAGLGVGSVRVFLDYEALGAGTPEPTVVAAVVDYLDRAAARDIGVVVTLFDGHADRSTQRWVADRHHLEGVVGAMVGHPALLAWDLKNEPDRDDDEHGALLVRAWLRWVGSTVRSLDPSTPVTIGWASDEHAAELLDVVDLVSFHHYGTPGSLDVVIPRLAVAVGGRPVVVSEIGMPTFNSWYPHGHTEAEQAHHLDRTIDHLETAGVGWMVWTLHDVATPPPSTPGGRRAGEETTFGLFRSDRSPKPAAAVVAGGDAAPVGPLDRLDKPFTWVVLTAGVAVAGVVGAGFAGRRRRLRRP